MLLSVLAASPQSPWSGSQRCPPVLHRRAGAAIWSTMTRDVVASLQGGGRSGWAVRFVVNDRCKNDRACCRLKSSLLALTKIKSPRDPTWKSGGNAGSFMCFPTCQSGMQEPHFNSKAAQLDIFLYLFHAYGASMRPAKREKQYQN